MCSRSSGFGIGYGIGRKYRPIRVSVSVSDRNQNSGFGRSLRYSNTSSKNALPQCAHETLITGPPSSLGHINVKNECLGIATLLHCIKASKF